MTSLFRAVILFNTVRLNKQDQIKLHIDIKLPILRVAAFVRKIIIN
jgi:hypothetical protein